MSPLGNSAPIAPAVRARALWIAVVIAIAFLASCAPEQSSGPFVVPAGATLIGNAPTQTSPVALTVIQKEPSSYVGKTVLIQATADEVCQAKGCWMTVKGEGPAVWVRWSSGCGGEFAFPQDVAGKKVVVEGTLREKELAPEEAQHLADESKGMTAAEIAGKTFEIDAVSCVILGASA